ncbi:uncharacterized protein BX663DRAFT_554632 [Cokeromyces recurvatus]|uniref:uncharacterized protein n=1 Tax=Cokeromyces recurvatus TaxID=90255 RepID=UPI00221E3C6B|nr:uncharacterized protein BX663DRAFT_554632 [Cokeromyces recurvatus]KAI7899676.1 hypothetical protein BX663DRAFT_554632 [Cokeromyces recurvatus]
MSEKYKNLKVKELQELLQKYNLPHSGKKEELIERLVRHDEKVELERIEKEFELDADFDDSKINLNDISSDIFAPIALEKPDVLEDETKKLKESDTTAKKTAAAIDNSTMIKKSPFKYTPITFNKKDSNSEKKNSISKNPTMNKAIKDPKTEKLRLEAERRLERSKRFGVKLTEDEMRKIRAARFGMSLDDKNNNKKEKVSTKNEDKLKKRAERFGVSKEENKQQQNKKQQDKSLQRKRNQQQKQETKKPFIRKVKQGRILSKKTNNSEKQHTLNNKLQRQQLNTSNRTVTIHSNLTKPTISSLNKQKPHNGRNIIIRTNPNNDRTVTIASNKNNNRKRGRGNEPSHSSIDTSKKRRQ